MPDGFDPHFELERAFTLRDLQIGSRQRLPLIFKVLDEAFASENMTDRQWAAEWAANRGFGKPRQHMIVEGDGFSNSTARRVLVLPDNKRNDNVSPVTIEGEPEPT